MSVKLSVLRSAAKDLNLVFRQSNVLVNSNNCYALYSRETGLKKSADAPIWWWSNELENKGFSDYSA